MCGDGLSVGNATLDNDVLKCTLAYFCRGLSGPHDAGHYNSSSWETGFFVSDGGNWSTPYGHFFLDWYSGLLMQHADRVLTAAAAVINKHGRPRVFKMLKQVRI